MEAVVRAAREEVGSAKWLRPGSGPGARSRSADPRLRLGPLESSRRSATDEAIGTPLEAHEPRKPGSAGGRRFGAAVGPVDDRARAPPESLASGTAWSASPPTTSAATASASASASASATAAAALAPGRLPGHSAAAMPPRAVPSPPPRRPGASTAPSAAPASQHALAPATPGGRLLRQRAPEARRAGSRSSSPPGSSAAERSSSAGSRKSGIAGATSRSNSASSAASGASASASADEELERELAEVEAELASRRAALERVAAKERDLQVRLDASVRGAEALLGDMERLIGRIEETQEEVVAPPGSVPHRTPRCVQPSASAAAAAAPASSPEAAGQCQVSLDVLLGTWQPAGSFASPRDEAEAGGELRRCRAALGLGGGMSSS
eukprot:TRINITY_DN7563_c0_g1_i1.p1 TRINITY_DN7563_c0_g1~~TRINITY_DN7563_c0_g1_i1.p1  ORF type:complete len:383 (-),score=95.66 TRINITY_DN7563_c0_g1_i1:265-1413(-)